MKKYLSLLLALCLTLSLAACGSKADTSANAADGSQTQDNASTEAPAGEPVELIVFAAASMTETMNQLKEVLSKLGITEIPALGEAFDPQKHNAVMHVEDEALGENTVAEVFQAGFQCGEKVIRFAMVKVAN